MVEKDVNEHVVNLKKEKENENVKKQEEREGVNRQRKKYCTHICLRHLDYWIQISAP